MIVKSLKLGQVEVPDDKIITLERPILGFENLNQFCLMEIEELVPFLLLQSTEEPAVAFLVVNPRVFFPDYRININPKEIAELNVARVESVETYVVVTLNRKPEEITVNLQGPILINTENNLAKQLILVNSEYHVKHSILAALESQNPAVKETEAVPV